MKMKTAFIFLAACVMILVGLEVQPSASTLDYFIKAVPVYEFDFSDSDCLSDHPNGIPPRAGTCRLDWCMTLSEIEMNSAIANGWVARDIEFYVSFAQIPGTVSLYRLYNPDLGDHLFTTSLDEMNSAIGMGFNYEGTVGYVFPANTGGPKTVNLHRFYEGGDNTYHRYSIKKWYQGDNEVYEGIQCNVWPGKVPLVSMSVIAPKENEQLQGNSEYKITWTSSPSGGFVNVFYSIGYRGGDLIPIAYGIQNQDQSFVTWKVPNINTTLAVIHIVWIDNLFGTSYELARVGSNVFTIKQAPLKLQPGSMTQVKMVAAKPSAPSPLTATTASASESRLSWKAPTGQPMGYVVERRIGQGMFLQVANIKAPGLAYSDKNVAPGTNYSYRVYAYNMAGRSGYSNEASAKTAFTLKKPISMKKKTTK
jgi:Repeat of unknown function (DUF5648)/Fibronectin type III domain